MAAVSAYALHAIYQRVWFLVDLVLPTFTQCHSTSLSSPPANFSFFFFLTFQLFGPDFQSHALQIDLNTLHTITHPAIHDFTSWAFFSRGPNSYRRNVRPRLHCSYVWYSYHANGYVSGAKPLLSPKWWPCFLVRLDRIGELPEKFLDFPCPRPIPDSTRKTFVLNAALQSSEFAAKYNILPESKFIIVSTFEHDG